MVYTKWEQLVFDNYQRCPVPLKLKCFGVNDFQNYVLNICFSNSASISRSAFIFFFVFGDLWPYLRFVVWTIITSPWKFYYEQINVFPFFVILPGNRCLQTAFFDTAMHSTPITFQTEIIKWRVLNKQEPFKQWLSRLPVSYGPLGHT